MDIPKDYVIEMVRNTLDEKINQLCDSQESLRLDIKNDIYELKKDLRSEIQNINTTCTVNMKDHNNRIRLLEEHKWKLYAFGGAVATVSAFVFNYILK